MNGNEKRDERKKKKEKRGRKASGEWTKK